MSDTSTENDEFGEKYFSKLRDTPFSSDKYKEEFGLIMKLLPPKPSDKILDMGCGKGQLGLFLVDKEKKCDVTFSDISSEAHKYVPGYKFIQCSMVSTPFSDNSFDKIYSLSTISYVDDIDEAIKEMYRVTRVGENF